MLGQMLCGILSKFLFFFDGVLLFLLFFTSPSSQLSVLLLSIFLSIFLFIHLSVCLSFCMAVIHCHVDYSEHVITSC